MKSRIFAAISLLAITGCASLHSQVHKDVHEGDSQDQVEQTLGEPDSFNQSQKDASVTVWNYKKKGDLCAIAFREQRVIGTSCQKDPNYRDPAAAILQGAGQGLQNGSQNANRPVNCSTTSYGNTANTTCF
jgi:hypothetical protein